MTLTLMRPVAPGPATSDPRPPAISAAARLLVECAGDNLMRGRMCAPVNGGTWAKYKETPDPLTLAEALDHMTGRTAYASRLWRDDGLTRVTMYDADSPADWSMLIVAAQWLGEVGLKPILEHSAARDGHAGGGHLILIWDAPVNRAGAFEALNKVAPGLIDVSEHFPRSTQCVRLPGGAYFPIVDGRPGPALFMRATDHTGAVLWERPGVDAARALLSCQSPSSWVSAPNYGERTARIALMRAQWRVAPIALDTCPPPVKVTPRKVAPAPGPATSDPRPPVGLMSVNINPRDVAVWFNDRHNVTDIAAGATDHAGKVLATWRGDRRANVDLYPASNTWCDRSSKATVKGGDCLELAALLSGDRTAFLSRARSDLASWAHSELMSAARRGRAADSLVWSLTTEIGRKKYQRELAKANATAD